MIGVVTCSQTWAQSRPQLSSLPTPGSVLESFTPQQRPLPVSPAQVLIPEQVDAPLHDRNGKRFQVHSFHFVGITAFEEQRLKRVLERFIDLELNLYDLGRAADAVTEFYHDRGYSLARAFIPVQKVDDGVVTLAVVEGRIGGVLFSGNDRYTSEWLALRTDDLAPDSLIKTQRLERNLLLLNDLPGVKARATLSPGPRFGTSDILIRVEENLLAGTLTVDNAGREDTGQGRIDLAGDINNPTGIGDQIKLRINRTEHDLTQFGSVGYNFPIGTDGMRLAANYSEVSYTLEGDFAALGIKGGARTADLTLSWPMTRSRGHNETLAFTLRKTELTQSVQGIDLSTKRVPMALASYQANWIGSDASVTTLVAQVGSNGKSSDSLANTDAVKLRIEVDGTYLLPINRNWDAYLRGAGVFSPDRLPDSEKYNLGGSSSVRGFQSSALRGDEGWQSTMELRRRINLWRVPASLNVFGDIGRVTNKAHNFDDSYEGITSFGVGMTAYPAAQTIFKVDVARATQGFAVDDGKKTRVWASLSTTF